MHVEGVCNVCEAMCVCEMMALYVKHVYVKGCMYVKQCMHVKGWFLYVKHVYVRGCIYTVSRIHTFDAYIHPLTYTRFTYRTISSHTSHAYTPSQFHTYTFHKVV